MEYKLNFRRTSSQNYYIACEVAKRAYKHVILDNEYPDDEESENHEVVFTDEQMIDMHLMLDIIGHSGLTEGPIGFNIYGIDIKYFVRTDHFCNWQIKLDPYKVDVASEIIGHILAKSVELNIEYRNSVELIKYLSDKYGKPINYNYRLALEHFRKWFDRDRACEWWYEKELRKQMKEEKQRILSQLVAEKQISSRWKSEEDLFRLIVSIYPDARFHYSPEWLFPQHYDIYVPLLQTAFEYQGIQHFRPVKIFGGQDKFEHQIRLDQRKKQLSSEHKVELIEWQYNEPISKVVLLKKMNQINGNMYLY